MIKSYYATPRIIIVTITQLVIHQPQLKCKIQSTHKNYYHLFNLTKKQIHTMSNNQYKWRNIPFSISEAFQILSDVDMFLRSNFANTAILIVQCGNMEKYAKFLFLAFLRICQISASINISIPKQITYDQPFLLSQLEKAYKTANFHNPPLKIIEELIIQNSNQTTQFIPIFKIYTETRYNDFQHVYTHDIMDELANYYVNLNNTLPSSIGKRYDDCKPETTFLKKPVIVYGDVKIQLFSFKQLKLKQQGTIGFSTNLLAQQALTFIPDDLYNTKQTFNVIVKISNYCEKCKLVSQCKRCLEMTKIIHTRYRDCQQNIQMISRQRTQKQVKIMLSI